MTAIDYRRKTVFIKWLGPHSQYDKIDSHDLAQQAAHDFSAARLGRAGVLSLNRGFFNGLQHLLDDLWVQNSANVEWQDHPNGLLYVDSMATLAPEKDESCF